MMKAIAGIFAALCFNVAMANPLTDAMRVEDQRRLCPAAEASTNTETIRSDVEMLAKAAGMAEGSYTLLVGNCEGYASAATTLNTIIVAPSLGDLPRAQRLFLLAHELGHLANHDAQQWAAFGDTLVGVPDGPAVEEGLHATSRALESGADAFAARLLRSLDVNPVMAANAFFRSQNLLKLPGTASHPAAKDRVAAIAEVVAKL